MTTSTIRLTAIRLLLVALAILAGAGFFAMLACEYDEDPNPGSDCGGLCIRLQECADDNDFYDQFESENDCNSECEEVEGDATTECMFDCAQSGLECREFLACVGDC